MSAIEVSPATAPRIYEGYYDLPKHIGSVAPEKLLVIADIMAEQAAAVDHIAAATPFHTIAGSAYAEAALVAANTIDDVDQLLELIDTAEHHLKQAAAGELDQLKIGMRTVSEQSEWRRAEVRAHFMVVYRDIVCGEVTRQTRLDVIDFLERQRREVDREVATGDTNLEGFGYEIDVLLLFWRHYQNDHQAIAIPATERGDNGWQLQHQTHDIDIISQRPDGSWRYDEAAEIKGGRGRRLVRHDRYEHPVIDVQKNGMTVYILSGQIPSWKDRFHCVRQ